MMLFSEEPGSAEEVKTALSGSGTLSMMPAAAPPAVVATKNDVAFRLIFFFLKLKYS